MDELPRQMLPGTRRMEAEDHGPKGEKVAAQLLAAMYDASLDHFVRTAGR
jgi:hypothetical protein